MAMRTALERAHDGLLAELEGIRDRYRLDVKQFIEFVKSRKLFIMDALEAVCEMAGRRGQRQEVPGPAREEASKACKKRMTGIGSNNGT